MTTPDGENCGLVKNLSSTGLVSTYVDVNLLDILIDSGMEELVDNMSISLGRKHKVFFNGDWVGVCDDAASLVDDFRSKRRRNEVPYQVLFVCVISVAILTHLRRIGFIWIIFYLK